MAHASTLSSLRSLTLTVTEQCNLRCSYCYVPKDRGRRMSPEVADRAVDFLIDQGRAQKRLSLSFFGGEPLLETALMDRVIDRMRSCGKPVRIVTPTNGLLLEGDRLAWAKERGLELAISVDGTRNTERRSLIGRDSAGELARLLPGILALGPQARLIGRMTVTPSNVGSLSANVRAVARLGFPRIALQPALEMPWDDAAIEAWGFEHRMIGLWLAELNASGARVPDLNWWRAVEERLLLHKPRVACGAGERVIAASPDGSLFPCFRLVFGQESSCVGNVETGISKPELLRAFATAHPDHARPERGSCESCPSHDGCTHFCPALGWLAMGNPNGIPDVACRLMRAQVEAIRPFASVRRRASKRRWARAAVVAAVVASAVAASGCGGQAFAGSDNKADAQPDDAAIGSDSQPDTYAGGLCPVEVDAQADDAYTGGLCPVESDAQPDDVYTGGLCDPQPEAGADDAYVGGLCPVEIDAQPDDDVYIGGECPQLIDAEVDDAMVPGLCAQLPDASEDVNIGGMCK